MARDRLIGYLRAHHDVEIGGACYPEGHVESSNLADDLKWTGVTYDEIRPGCFDGAERLKDMDADGVDAEILFAPQRTIGHFLGDEDDDFVKAGVEAYNDFLREEFCAPDRTRLIGLAQISSLGTERAVKELEAAAKRYDAPVTTVGPFTRTNPPPALQDEPAVVGAAFGVPLNRASFAIVGQRAVYLVQPTARRQADSTAFVRQLATQREQALQLARQSRVRLVMSSLREQADVDDRRKALAQAQRAAQEQQEALQRTQQGVR